MDVQNILSTIDLAELRNHIIQTSIVAWKNYITESSLDRWLKNFDGAALGNAVVEQTIAAWLLLNFTYYTDTEVRELCKIIYRKFIHRKLQEEYYQRSSEDVQTKIQRILTRTIFLPLGNPSESGALILYNFRTANALPKRVFNQPIDWSTKLSDSEEPRVGDLFDEAGRRSAGQVGDFCLRDNAFHRHGVRTSVRTQQRDDRLVAHELVDNVHSRCRVVRVVLHNDLERATEHAAGSVDFADSHLDALHGALAVERRRAGDRGGNADADGIGACGSIACGSFGFGGCGFSGGFRRVAGLFCLGAAACGAGEHQKQREKHGNKSFHR